MKQQSKKYLILVLLIAVLVAPSFALASWYNPFSWHIWSNIWNYVFHQQALTVQQQNTNYDFSKLNTDDLLHKLFPNLYFKNGVADLSKNNIFNTTRLYLKKSIEDYFVNKQEKNLLLIAQLDGVAHAGGLYHAYLGLFDQNGNLITPSSSLPFLDNPEFDLYRDSSAHFGGDYGQFGFYDCNGIKYILFVSSGCPNSTCCSDKATLYRINNGNFENLQTINGQSLTKANNNFLQFIQTANAAEGPYYGLKMILLDNKIIIKKVPFSSDNGCSEVSYKELSWDKNSCRFVESKTTAAADPTAGWKTYTNIQYGFEFKYPKDWAIEPVEESNMVNVWSSTEKMQSSKGAIIPIYPEFSVKYWSADSFKDFASGLGLASVNNAKDFVGGNFSKHAEIVVGGKKAYAAISVANRAVYTAYIDFNGVYVLSAGLSDESSQDPQNPGLNKDIKNIISTFKFTK